MGKIETILSSLSLAAIYSFGIILSSSCFGAGYAVGRRYGTHGQFIGAGIAGTIGVTAALGLRERREKIAVVELQRNLARLEDPSYMDPQLIQNISAKFGVNVLAKYHIQLRSIYDAYITNALPIERHLTGNEIDLITRFKHSLGISDEDAVAVHIDIGRRINRLRSEADSNKRIAKITRFFHKFIYISTQVFGDTAFLLCWKRYFNMSDAQLSVAKIEYTKQLFKHKLNVYFEKSLYIDDNKIKELQVYSEKISLRKEVAAEIISKVIRTAIETKLSEAIEIEHLVGWNRISEKILSAVAFVLEHNSRLNALSKTENFLLGLNPIELTKHTASESKRNEYIKIYRTYLEEQTKGGDLLTIVEDNAYELRKILGISRTESADINSDVQKKAYLKALREKFTSGELNAAESKAATLNDLCYRLNISLDTAREINNSVFKQRLEQLVEKGAITDADEIELEELRVLLCTKKNYVRKTKDLLCGQLFRQAIQIAFSTGLKIDSHNDTYDVIKRKLELRLDNCMAKEILGIETRKVFMRFVSNSRTKSNQLDAVKVMKDMVIFSNTIVSPLLSDMCKKQEKEKNINKNEEGSSNMDQQTEKISLTGERTQNSEQQYLRQNPIINSTKNTQNINKHNSEKKSLDIGQRNSMNEIITLVNDLSLLERQDIYKNFLQYCRYGVSVSPELGSTLVHEFDDREFDHLKQLGNILGLSQLHLANVHQSVAELAYKTQVQRIYGSGEYIEEKIDKLINIRKRFGLVIQRARDIIDEVYRAHRAQNNEVSDYLRKLKAGLKPSMENLLKLSEHPELENLVKKDLRLQIYRNEVEILMTNGTGNFDKNKFLINYPKALKLYCNEASRIVEDIAKGRIRPTLVQAISFYRQNNRSGTVKSLQNLVSQFRAFPHHVAWEYKEDIEGVYMHYASQCKSQELRQEVARALGIKDAEAKELEASLETEDIYSTENDLSYFG